MFEVNYCMTICQPARHLLSKSQSKKFNLDNPETHIFFSNKRWLFDVVMHNLKLFVYTEINFNNTF